MDLDFDFDSLLEPRVPKGGGASGGRGGSSSGGKSSSSKGSKGSKGSKSSKTGKNKSKGPVVVGAGGAGGGNSGFNRLPVWARVLIILGIIWFILFLIALTYYLLKELKRKKDGKSFRLGHALGHALLVSTGLWVPVYIYKKLATRRKTKSKNGTFYAKIEEGHAKERNSSDRDSWYAGGASNDQKYDEHRPRSPVPPPYAPAPAPTTQTNNTTTGAAADYYMPQPPSHTAPTQHPPQYG